MTTPMHDRLVASLRALGATDEPAGKTHKFTVLRLDVLFRKDGDTLATDPLSVARFWLVSRAGAMRTVYGRPVVGEAQVVTNRIKAHLLNTAPIDAPRLARPGDRRRRV